MECAHITVRGFNAHYNKWVTFTNLELEVEGLYQIIQNENILERFFSCVLCLLISALEYGFSKNHCRGGFFPQLCIF